MKYALEVPGYINPASLGILHGITLIFNELFVHYNMVLVNKILGYCVQ